MGRSCSFARVSLTLGVAPMCIRSKLALVSSLLAFVILPWAGNPLYAQDAPRKDTHGYPLPPEATARLGTLSLRLSSGGRPLAPSPDNRFIGVVSGDGEIRLYDRKTGN